MKRLKLLWTILRSINADKIVLSYIIWFVIFAFIITGLEPTINTIADGFWYGFSVASTIGFGDFIATTFVSRIITILLSLSSIFVIALIPAVIINYFIEFNKLKNNDSVVMFLDQLEKLDQLSPQELKNIADQVKKKRYRL